MEVFRLSKSRYSHKLSGQGAALAGARWNSKGLEMVYTGESQALALAEVVVHLPQAALPRDFRMLQIFLPEDHLAPALKNPPAGWNRFPPEAASQKVGDAFLQQGRYLALPVPSVVVPGDWNYVLNPYHPQFSQVKILDVAPFLVDGRL